MCCDCKVLNNKWLNRWSLQGSDIRHMINGPESPIFLTTDGVPKDVKEDSVAAMQVDLQNFGIEFTFQTAGRDT